MSKLRTEGSEGAGMVLLPGSRVKLGSYDDGCANRLATITSVTAVPRQYRADIPL